MTTELMVFEANGQEVELTSSTVKDYLVNGDGTVTDQEVTMFMELCKYQQLNPFLKEAYLIKYSDKSPAQIVVGKEAYMKRAQAQPDYERFEAGLIVDRQGEILELEGSFKLPKDSLLGGWAKVYRRGIKEPNVAKVSIAEYSQGQSTWNQKPATMIRKVAIVQAIRETYPEQFGGMYINEEIAQVQMQEKTHNYAENTRKTNNTNTANKQTIPGAKQEPEPDVVEEVVEAEAEEIKTIDQGQAGLMFDLAEKRGIKPEEIQEFMVRDFNKEKSIELTEDELVRVIEWIDSKGKTEEQEG